MKDQLSLQAVQLQRYERELGGAIATPRTQSSADEGRRRFSTALIVVFNSRVLFFFQVLRQSASSVAEAQQQLAQMALLNNTDMSRIMQDNKDLHFKMNSLQSELIHLIKGACD